MNNDWNPELYLKFSKERIQPSIDLISRTEFENPRTVIDIGCGPGNSTQVLIQRWPKAEVTGVDNSPAMISKAKQDYPMQKWRLFDAGTDRMNETFDIVFSNATIQWIPDHEKLIRSFFSLLNNDGVLAVQIPLFFDMPVGNAIHEVAARPEYKKATGEVRELFTIHHPHFYYDQLSQYFKVIDIWTTDYYHTMDSHSAIMDMIRSTGLKPYLERISGESEKKKFESLVFERIQVNYPLSRDGRVLFPFKRLFFVAKK